PHGRTPRRAPDRLAVPSGAFEPGSPAVHEPVVVPPLPDGGLVPEEGEGEDGASVVPKVRSGHQRAWAQEPNASREAAHRLLSWASRSRISSSSRWPWAGRTYLRSIGVSSNASNATPPWTRGTREESG